MPRPKDESYVIDLCDAVLGQAARRGHKFEFLRGDLNQRGTRAYLPVDAFYPELALVIEYNERQHSETVKFFDRRMVPGGITRGEQRSRYDQRRRDTLPKKGISLLVLSYADFEHDASKRLKRGAADIAVIREKLRPWVRSNGEH